MRGFSVVHGNAQMYPAPQTIVNIGAETPSRESARNRDRAPDHTITKCFSGFFRAFRVFRGQF
jgi:hypothetical protein